MTLSVSKFIRDFNGISGSPNMGAHIGITDYAFQLPNEFRNTGRHKDFLIDSFIYMS